MAFNDIKSTQERIASLRGVIALLNQSIKSAQLAQKYYNQESNTDNYGEFPAMWDGVKDRLAESVSAATLANADLTTLLAQDAFIFRYEWVIGRKGLTQIVFEDTADTATIGAADSTQDGDGDVVLDGDFLLITGTASNDGLKPVLSAATNVITFYSSAALADETCTNNGAKMTLVTRLA